MTKYEIVFLILFSIAIGYAISMAAMVRNFNIKKNCEKIVCEMLDELNAIDKKIESGITEDSPLYTRRAEIFSYLEKIYGYSMNPEILKFIKSKCSK